MYENNRNIFMRISNTIINIFTFFSNIILRYFYIQDILFHNIWPNERQFGIFKSSNLAHIWVMNCYKWFLYTFKLLKLFSLKEYCRKESGKPKLDFKLSTTFVLSVMVEYGTLSIGNFPMIAAFLRLRSGIFRIQRLLFWRELKIRNVLRYMASS